MDKKKRTKILGGIVAVLLLGIAVFFGGFRVTSVKVEGNTAHTDKEIKKMVLQGSLASNTILVRFLNPSEKTKDDQFIQKVWIEPDKQSIINHSCKGKRINWLYEIFGWISVF